MKRVKKECQWVGGEVDERREKDRISGIVQVEINKYHRQLPQLPQRVFSTDFSFICRTDRAPPVARFQFRTLGRFQAPKQPPYL